MKKIAKAHQDRLQLMRTSIRELTASETGDVVGGFVPQCCLGTVGTAANKYG